MANPLSAMLDELMGKHRNAMPTDEKKETTWEDPEVCPYFLAGYCPHEMFTNTRADLGPCYRLHDENLREQYRTSDRFEKAGLDDEFLEYLQRVQNDMQRKIDRNKQRLDITQPGGEIKDASVDNILDKVTQLTEKITALLSQAEQLGEKGQVEEAQGVVTMMEELKEERDRLQQNLDVPTGELRSMEVCDICGCFLIMGDAQHRLDEHFTGKQHIGFAKIKVTVDELLRRKQEKRDQRDKELKQMREKEDEERRKRRSKRSRSKKRSRSRDRNHHNNSSSRREKRSRSRFGHRRSSGEKHQKSSTEDRRRRSKSREEKRSRKEDEKVNKDGRGRKEDEKSRSHRHHASHRDDKRKDGRRREDDGDRRHHEHSSTSKKEDGKSNEKQSKRRAESTEKRIDDAEKKGKPETNEVQPNRNPSHSLEPDQSHLAPPSTQQVNDSDGGEVRMDVSADNGYAVDVNDPASKKSC